MGVQVVMLYIICSEKRHGQKHIYTHIYTHTHTNTHTYRHTYTHTYLVPGDQGLTQSRQKHILKRNKPRFKVKRVVYMQCQIICQYMAQRDDDKSFMIVG